MLRRDFLPEGKLVFPRSDPMKGSVVKLAAAMKAVSNFQPPGSCVRVLLGFAIALGGLSGPGDCLAQASGGTLGQANILRAPKGFDERLPQAPFRSERLLGRAAQTSQWYSTLIFHKDPYPIFAQPLSVRPVREGLELALPVKQVRSTPRKDTEIAFPHELPVTLGSTAFAAGQPKLDEAHDWSFRMTMGRGDDEFAATVVRGSPYVYLEISRGDLRLQLPANGRRTDSADDPRRLAIEIGGRHFAFFLPSGGSWERKSNLEWTGRLPQDKRYASAAVLPDGSPESLAMITRHAHIHTVSTSVQWHFNPETSRVKTTFRAQTVAREGPDVGPLYGLYPHHWHANESVAARLGPAYASVRGPLRLLQAPEFSTDHPFHGFVPFLPPLGQTDHRKELSDLISADLRNAAELFSPEGDSAYWQGKSLQRMLKLADVLEQEGHRVEAGLLVSAVKSRMEHWLRGKDRRRYFFFDQKLGVMATHPSEFHAIEEINDQHFWFGYWIRSAAEVALRDREWASTERWGKAVDLMVDNIANPDRQRADVPFLRTFDPYEGHSWANGVGGAGETGRLGNNQESSSEALNAWAGLLLWAEVRGDRRLRDLAAYLYATEWQAVEHYWFDVHRLVLPSEYRNVDVALLFGAGYAHNTWWTDEPRQITGINLLPITTSSMPLARHPSYIRRNLGELPREQALAASRGVRGKPADIWQDIFAKYLALADPAQALATWNRQGAVELGETRTATLHWMLSLQALGAPDFSLTADNPLHAVFVRPDGQRTRLAFNAGSREISVRFSDGLVLEVKPGQMARHVDRRPE